MPRRSKLNDFSWKLLLGFAGFVDGAQVILDAVAAAGVAINRGIDIFFGGGLALLLFVADFQFDGTVWKWLIGSFIAEEIPVVDVAPLWTLDVWKFWKMDKERGEAAKEGSSPANVTDINANRAKKSSPDNRDNQRAA